MIILMQLAQMSKLRKTVKNGIKHKNLQRTKPLKIRITKY